MMLIPLPKLLTQPSLWRFVGFASSVVGLLCYALSYSFTRLFGYWNLFKIIVYSVVSLIICSFIVFPKKWNQWRSLMAKAHAGFLVLVLTSAYSFFYDKAVNGSKPDLLSLISCVAFAFMALSLSRQTDLGFEVELLNFFLGCFILQLMKIDLVLAFAGAAFSYSLIVLRSSLDSQIEIGTVTTTDHVGIDVDSANQTDDRNHHHQSQSLRLRKVMPTWTEQIRVSTGMAVEGPLDDGYSWRKYGQKDILGATFPRWYYRCAHRNVQGCLATKQVQRSDEDPTIFEITYRGKHTCAQASNVVPPSGTQENQEPHPSPTDAHQLQSQEELLSNLQGGLRVQTQNLDVPESETSSNMKDEKSQVFTSPTMEIFSSGSEINNNNSLGQQLNLDTSASEIISAVASAANT